MTATSTRPPSTLSTPDVPNLLERFEQLRVELNAEILESADRIDGALIALVAGEHMAMVGSPGCLAGDTIVRTNRNGATRKTRLDHIVRRLHDPDYNAAGRPWDPSITTRVQRAEGSWARLASMADAWESGMKRTIEVRTAGGRSIRATEVHPFLRAEGEWAPLGQLAVGDALQVHLGLLSKGGTRRIHYRSRSTKFHPYQRATSTEGQFRHLEHRMVMEAYLNQMSFEEFVSAVRFDADRAASLFYLPTEITVHHIDHNPSNNALNNLAFMTPQAHGSEHGPDNRANVLASIGVDIITSIREHGDEMTYDVEVVDDPHNFIANEFVVHNTAKTYLVDRLVARISRVNYYSEGMKKMMPTEEVFGQVSIQGLKNDEWRRVTTGMLPEADVALIDEFTRTSDAILNSLLEMLNERRFKNGATKGSIPLSTAFLCANSFPTGEAEHDLEAFWDRVVMRFEVEAPKDEATWKAIARMRHPEFPPAVLSWDDVLEAKRQARALPITDEAFDAIDEIRIALGEVGITMSPRRCRQAQFVAAAWAWLCGAPAVLPEHCVQLIHMLWDVPEQRSVVMRKVIGIVAPGEKAAIDLADGVQELIDEVDETLTLEPSDRMSLVNELHDKIGAQKAALAVAVPTATGRAATIMATAASQLNACHIRLLVEGLGMNLADLVGLGLAG